METLMYLALKDLLGPRRGDDPSWVHKCQNGRIGHLRRPSTVRKPWRSRHAKPRFTTLDIPFGPMPWGLACCRRGCLLFTEGMTTRTGQRAACGAKGGIMDRTKS